LACLKSYYPVKEKYFGTFVGSFISAIAMTEVTNWIVKKDIQVSKAIAANGNEFERLCESCYRNLDLIQVTLKNDKCYVGNSHHTLGRHRIVVCGLPIAD